MKITTRRLMILVAVAGFVLFGMRTLLSFLESMDEPFGEGSRITKSWNLGLAPTIFVDCFEGTIAVAQSPDGQVTAEIVSTALAQDWKPLAVEGLKSIAVEFDQQGDTLRIVARGASEDYNVRNYNVSKAAHVTLLVPPNARLDLRTGRGNIVVGQISPNGGSVLTPLITPSVRARNDSKSRLFDTEGNITISTTAPQDQTGSRKPTRLQLEAPGRIEVAADLATLEAYAWHGVPPQGWTPAQAEDGDEGTILFEGTLAAGQNNVRAAHRLELKLPQSTSLQLDAEATNGDITGTLMPQPIKPTAGHARWSGSTSSATDVILNLRTNDGPILLNSCP